jgi:menaquinone-9 beta-reductase
MDMHEISDRYDVVIAGARCAGASTAMLLARSGLRVLVADPARPGSDTLSTHALMRGAVSQLHRWGVLDEIRAAGTPPVRTTSFHYGGADGDPEVIRIPIADRDGVDALYAPRRTVLDPVLQGAATRAGATIVLGSAVSELVMERGRVRGAVLSWPDGSRRTVSAEWIVGADGVRSKVARLAGAEVRVAARQAAATVYGYWSDPGWDGYVWTYRPGVSVGAIPTNDGQACVFTAMPRERFRALRGAGLEAVHRALLDEGAPELDEVLRSAGSAPGALRAFAGTPGFLRRSAGPGWALVGDAGYFRDPITAHGITDALRDAELLARALLAGRDEDLREYVRSRDALVEDFLGVTDRIASFDWNIDEVKELHLDLSRSMKRQASFLDTLDAPASGLHDVGAPRHLDGAFQTLRGGALGDVGIERPVDLVPGRARR